MTELVFLQAIENSISQLGGLLKNQQPSPFIKSTYIHEQNGQLYPQYLLNRDGFTFVVMSFTGEKATQLKWNYIQEFNAMEEQLKRQNERPKAPTPVADMVSDVGAVAANIQSLFAGVQRGIALSQAIDLVGSFKNFSLDSLKQLLPPAEHDTGYQLTFGLSVRPSK